MRIIVRLLFILPTAAAQAACLYLLFRSKLTAKQRSPKFWSGLGFWLFFTGAIAVRLLATPWMQPILELGIAVAAALTMAGGAKMLAFLWAGIGALLLQGARSLAEVISVASGVSAAYEYADAWPDILIVLIEIGCLAAITLAVMRAPRLSDDLPSRVLNVGSIACVVLCFVAGASLQFIDTYLKTAQGAWNAFGASALCIGCLCVILYLLSQMSGQHTRTELRHDSGACCEEERRQTAERDFVRRWRHDEKQHLAVLSQMAKAGRNGDLVTYLESLSGKLDAADPAARTGSDSMDALLEEKRARCQKAGIEWRILISDDFDAGALGGPAMTTILGNAFENAIESCAGLEEAETKPFIESQFQVQDDMIKISMANSAGESRQPDDPTRTSKAIDRHGLGLSQIAEAAESAGGFLRIRRLPSLFRLDIWLPRGGDRA